MMLLGMKNNNAQTVLTGGLIDLGNVYRKYCKRINGITTFAVTSNGASLQQQGIYHVTATVTFTGTAVGTATIGLITNGNTANILTFASETIDTAGTGLQTAVLDYFILVDGNCTLGCPNNDVQTLSLINTGVGIVATNVIFNVVKEA